MNFTLPAELEAREPAELRGDGRDDVRLMVTRRDDDSIVHAHFRDFPKFLRAGDLLVLNTTATLPAAVENLHISTPLPGGLVVVEPRGELRPLPGGAKVTLLAPYRDSQRLWIARLDGVADLRAYLSRYGRPITYSYIDRPFPLDAYQTVFAEEPGSAEMPSAGRAFTRQLLVCLRRRGVRLAKLVLHAGVASLESHEPPYDELYEVPARTAEEVRRAKERGGRVVAVGTTVVRALEDSASRHGHVRAGEAVAELVVGPETPLHVVSGLLTGIHMPGESHYRLLSAFAAAETLARSAAFAAERGYRVHEFGDAALFLPDIVDADRRAA